MFGTAALPTGAWGACALALKGGLPSQVQHPLAGALLLLDLIVLASARTSRPSRCAVASPVLTP